MSEPQGNERPEVEATLADGPEEVAEMPTCPNCGTVRSGEYCSACGQRLWDERLTLGALWRRGVQQLFNVERGLLRTMREMMTDPGGVARRYVAGHRRRYLNPFTYLLLCSAIGLIVYRGVERLGGFSARDYIPAADMPPEMARVVVELIDQLQDNSAWSSLALCVPFALLLRWFFRRSGVNLAEAFVLSLFALGQVALLQSLLYIPTLFLPSAYYDLGTANQWSFVVAFAIVVQAVLGYFGKRFFNGVKGLFVAMLSYAGLMLTVAVATFVLMIRNPTLMQGAEEQPTLFRAAAGNELEVMWSLLEDGVDVKQPRADTALHLAAANGHLEMVNLLIAQGADLEAIDHEGYSVLMRAIQQRRREVAVALVGRGAEVHRPLADGTTPLMLAANRSSQVVETLIEAGAQVNATRDHRLATALMIAADAVKPERVEALLAAGADSELVNRHGETALQIAKTKNVDDLSVVTRVQMGTVIEVLELAVSQ